MTTAAYRRALPGLRLPALVRQLDLVTLLVTVGRVLFDSLAGYALARLRFRGRGVVFAA